MEEEEGSYSNFKHNKAVILNNDILMVKLLLGTTVFEFCLKAFVQDIDFILKRFVKSVFGTSAYAEVLPT